MSTKKTPSTDPLAAIARNVAENLRLLGEDPAREGLKETPKRHAKAMQFLMSGYEIDINQLVGRALFTVQSPEMVIVRDIEMFSLCEHHLLPFYGRVHVGYIPNGKIIGLSKIPRIIDAFARRAQVQERLCSQVADAMMQILKPRGVGVVIEASHLCMMMRGVEKQNSYTITSAQRGIFQSSDKTRKEFMTLLGGLGRAR